jgi:hypothetical protein
VTIKPNYRHEPIPAPTGRRRSGDELRRYDAGIDLREVEAAAEDRAL